MPRSTAPGATAKLPTTTTTSIKPDVVFVNVKEGLLEKHPEGRYYMSHNGGWIDAGTDALEAQRKRKQRLALDEFNRLSGKTSAQSPAVLPGSADRITLAAAAEKYFANCEARGLDSETIRKYRAAVDPFVEHCGVTYVDECRDNKQVLLNYMGWLRKQAVPKRKHSNPERTLANKVGDVRIFLKEFGISKLLKKNEEPKYHEKKVVAHPDDELDVLYGAADADETFLLDFFIGSMARDHEAYGKYGDPDLTGTTLTFTASTTRPARPKSVSGSPMPSESVGSTAIPKVGLSTAAENPTSTCSANCSTSLRRRGRRSIPNFTNCAKPAQAGDTLPVSPCRRSCSNWGMSR
jgi:hypothetical protein